MERASRLMGQLHFPGDSVSAEQLVCAAWSAAVGARIAKHARAERLVRTKLIVGVDDSVWQRQLFGMSRMILSKLTENLGDGLVVDELEFRVAAPRRGPQRAERSTTALPADEADAIEDVDLRRLYITSRKKELA
jgi:predicted nucleic acid-binding Zn ribbon protein